MATAVLLGLGTVGASTIASATPAAAAGEQTSCGVWMPFDQYQGPASGNVHRSMWMQTCIQKTVTSGVEYFAGTLTVFNGSGTTTNFGHNYGRWGSRELQFTRMVGEGMGTPNQGGKELINWYPNNSCFRGEIRAGEYKSCTSPWVKDDSPATPNRVFGGVRAYAWMPQPGMNTYESANFGITDGSPWLN
ncbi:hypothetical protein [Streptomyces sp. NPDC005805]|uniref:hypothetical protein n=1 Tax=Streptomyces sp. NPDC005805 TaxID=3157068 RepID=UPI0033FAA438